MHRPAQFGDRPLALHDGGNLCDEVGGPGSHDVASENLIRLFVEDDLHETAVLTCSQGLSVTGKIESSDADLTSGQIGRASCRERVLW